MQTQVQNLFFVYFEDKHQGDNKKLKKAVKEEK